MKLRCFCNSERIEKRNSLPESTELGFPALILRIRGCDVDEVRVPKPAGKPVVSSSEKDS